MDSDRIGACLDEAIRSGAFPGAVLLVSRGDDVVYHHATGHSQRIPTSDPMRLDTVFDLASVTKVVATTTLAMKAVADGILDLNRPVVAFLPSFAGPGKEAILVRHLLAHASGIPAWRPYFEPHKGARWQDARDAIRHTIAEEPLEAAPGTRCLYSDLSMILVAWILEALLGERLDHLADRLIFKPLGMADTFHSPRDQALPRSPAAFAATENCPWRKEVLRGRVHDDNCFVMGGVSGHAGLFGTAHDLFKFARALLSGRIVSHDLLRLFWTRDATTPGSTRALGWDTRSNENGTSGSFLSPGSIGHTGFTGTSLWIDPPRDLVIVLLTNRIHPRRDNELIKIWRPQIHDVVMTAL